MADDVWNNPIESAIKIQGRIEERAEQEAAEAKRHKQYRELWGECLSGSDRIRSLLTLTSHIKSQHHEFWIDLVEFNLKRLHKARGTSPSLRDYAVVSAVGVIRSALANDVREANKLASIMRSTFQEGGFFSAFSSVRAQFEIWELDREFPATPHMTTEELVAALRGTPGFSRATIFRMRDDGRILAEEPHEHLTQFRHIRPSDHLTILRAVRALFEKNPEFQAKKKKSHTRKRKSH